MAQKSEKSSGKKTGTKLLLISGVVLLLLFAGIGIGGFLFSGSGEESFISRFTEEAEATETAVPLEEFLVNLNSESPRNSPIVRMVITVTSLNEDANEIITADIAKVRDAVIHSVSNQSAETIYNEEEGHFLIKNDIKDRINQALEEDIIEDVYITDILLQK